MEFLLAAAGLIILVLAGDALVRGAVATSLRLGVPTLVVGLTIVAFGTSAPEMLVSVRAALAGAPGLALGNVIGSNIANVFLVLGIPALIAAMGDGRLATRESYLQMVAVSLLFILLLSTGALVAWHGLLLLGLLAIVLAKMLRDTRRSKEAGAGMLDDVEDAARMPVWQSVTFLVAGIVGLPLGAELLVDAARTIALDLGVADEVIGLTLVAVGTSLPELATTVMAAIRRETAVAMGNVIGSNLFNILAIMGVTSFFGPLAVDPALMRKDVWMMLAAALALMPFAVFGRRIRWPMGMVFLAVYSGYTISLF